MTDFSKYRASGKIRMDGRNGYHLHVDEVFEGEKETGITIVVEQINRNSNWTQKYMFNEKEFPTIKAAIEEYEKTKPKE